MRTLRPNFLLPALLLSTALAGCGSSADSTDDGSSDLGGSAQAGQTGSGKAGSTGASAGTTGSGGATGQAGSPGKGGADAAGGGGAKATGGASGGNDSGGNTGTGGKGQAGGGAGQGGKAQGGSAQGGEGGSAQGGGAQGGGAGEGGSSQGGSSQAGSSQGGGGGESGGSSQGGSAQGGQGQGGDSGGSSQGGSAQAGSSQGGSAQGGQGQAGQSGCVDGPTGNPCYTGPDGTLGLGACKAGNEICSGGVISCQGDVLPGAEVCDGVDNDCNGQIDDGFGPVTCGQGACQVTVQSCDNGVAVNCVPLQPAPAEACNGIDDTCDGTIDEGCSCLDGATQPCYSGPVGTDGVGSCSKGVQTCSFGQWGACEGEVTPVGEVCDGVDNDCNGQLDDGLAPISCGVGACANTVEACNNGQPVVCSPLPAKSETCNNIDDDCDGFTDEDNVCCPVDLRCGALCCPSGQACSFQQCVVPGDPCYYSEDCGPGQYCEYSLGTPLPPPDPQCVGAQQKTGKCLPKPPICPAGQEPGDPPTCLTKCEYKPPAPSFEPVVKYSWGGQTTAPYASDVMMTPLVIQLDDDDCDGKITERDIPEIVFTTFSGGAYTANGTLHAISIVKGQVVNKWSLPGVIWASSELAAGNIDGVPGNEIVGRGQDGFLYAIKADGTQLWKSDNTVSSRFPAIADFDGDGLPEVLASGSVFDGKTGKRKLNVNVGNSSATDVDGDGKLDIVGAVAAYKADGTLIANTGLATGATNAIGDLDNDGVPEIVTVSNQVHQMHIWHVDPTQPGKYKIIRQGIDINGTLNPALCPAGSAGNTGGGGPPTIGDFNGDGVPDVALAGGVGYAVFDGKKLMDTAVPNQSTFLWVKQTKDCSSAVTGSSLFDFNGDGKAEVLYGDENNLRIYEGATGTVLYQTCNTSGTLYEYPVVADVDNDGQADIVVASNAYAFQCTDGTRRSGIRVFGSKNGSWVRTRRVWNQHTYHVTNVNEDGSIPKSELQNYLQPGLNNFRLNKQPAGEFAAPDLVVSLSPTCGGQYALVAMVRNLGEAQVDAGVKVGFYEGDPAAGGVKLGEAFTTNALYPAEGEAVSLPLAQPPAGDVYAVVDDGNPPVAHNWVECRTDNNKSAPSAPICVQ